MSINDWTLCNSVLNNMIYVEVFFLLFQNFLKVDCTGRFGDNRLYLDLLKLCDVQHINPAVMMGHYCGNESFCVDAKLLLSTQAARKENSCSSNSPRELRGLEPLNRLRVRLDLSAPIPEASF